MNDQEKENSSKDFGKVIDVLHNKSKLSSLRTYQGDVAEFIKEKNESVISVAVKEKKRDNERGEEQGPIVPEFKPIFSNLRINFTMLFLSIFLVIGGITAFLYIFEYLRQTPGAPVLIDKEIIPHNNIVTLVNITNTNLASEISKLSPANGISIIKISDPNGHLLTKAQEFFNFLEISPPETLRRTLKNDFVVGSISQGDTSALFLVITVSDFGRAFSSMLDWEANIENDLSFLMGSTTENSFIWKDLIIKNKDTRGLVNKKNQAKIAYAFLDKNTILIVNSLSAIGDISSAYASRSVAR